MKTGIKTGRIVKIKHFAFCNLEGKTDDSGNIREYDRGHRNPFDQIAKVKIAKIRNEEGRCIIGIAASKNLKTYLDKHSDNHIVYFSQNDIIKKEKTSCLNLFSSLSSIKQRISHLRLYRATD